MDRDRNTWFSPTAFLGRQLRQRVILLSLTAILGLGVAVGLGLRASITDSQMRLEEAGWAAAHRFDTFLLGIVHDLQATGDSLDGAQDIDMVFQRMLRRQPAVFELLLVDRQGQVNAYRRRVGPIAPFQVHIQTWEGVVQVSQARIGQIYYDQQNVPFVDIAVAVVDETSGWTSTLVARVDLTTLWDTIIRLRIQKTGYVYIVDAKGQLLAFRDLQLVQRETMLSEAVGKTPQTVFLAGLNMYVGLDGKMVLASAVPMEVVPWFVIVEQPIAEALRFLMWLTIFCLTLLALALLSVTGIVRFVYDRISLPLVSLREGIDRLRKGELGHRIAIQAPDELGAVAGTFNMMAVQLQESIGTLEQRVLERTRNLQAAAEVAHVATSIFDLDKMLTRVVALINSRFGLYHTSLFLTQDDGSAVLHANIGNAGPLNLEGEFRLDAGETSMVGWCIAHGQPYVSMDVHQDVVYLLHPLLPNTKSEVTLPLIARGRVIGALDMQSEQEAAFDEADLAALQTMSNQIAVAIDNARLYEKARTRASHLAAANREINAANKELEAFSYSVSHDLRAPLRHIGSFARLLDGREHETMDTTSRHYLENIIDSCAKMERLIEGLLSFSRMGRTEIKMRHVDLDVLVREARRELAPELEGRHISWRIAPLPSVEGDPRLLQQVWINLLSNALKYTSLREEAHIEVGLQDGEEMGWVTFFVRDNGAGFDPQYAHKLFGVFQRLHHQKEFDGTGIGLAIVRRIVHRHGGRVWAEGGVDRGATFYFTLKKYEDLVSVRRG